MTKDLTQGSPVRLILGFALPLLAGMLFQQLYNLVDTLIVGRFLGMEALAGVGATGSINFLVLGFCMGICSGFAIPVAQQFGAHEESRMREFVSNGTWLSIVFAAVMTVLTVVYCADILRLMNTPEDIFDDAYTYIMIICGGIFTQVLYNLLSSILRALGNSKTPLYFLLLSAGLNIVLDLVLIINFNMGVLGAAVATDVSQAISGVISLIYLIKKFKILHMTRDEWKYSRSTCRRLSAMGLPMGLQCTITAVGGVIMQWAVNGLGSSVVAAITAAGKTQNLLSCALESIGTAMATYAGQNLGAARLDRVRSGVKSSYIMVVAYSVLAFIALHFGDVVIIGLFLDTKTEVEIVAMARDYMFWNSLFFIPLGALIVWRYTIQGLGYSTLAMMAGVAEMVARTVIALVLIPVLGYFGAELSNPVAWVAACLFLYPAYLWTVKHLENRLLAGHLAMRHSAVGD